MENRLNAMKGSAFTEFGIYFPTLNEKKNLSKILREKFEITVEFLYL